MICDTCNLVGEATDFYKTEIRYCTYSEKFEGTYCSEICFEWRHTKHCKSCQIEFPFEQVKQKFCSEQCSRMYVEKRQEVVPKQIRSIEFLSDLTRWLEGEDEFFQFNDQEIESLYEEYLLSSN